jgi:hypothetical protein
MARFFRRGKTQVVFTLTCPNINAPVVGNVTSGTNLSSSIHDMAGFTFANKPIDAPDLSTPFQSKIAGPDEATDSTIKYYRDSTTNPLDLTLAKGVNGFVVIGDYKILGTWATGDNVDVWPVQVGSNAKEYSVGNDPALAQVTFIVTAAPALNVTLN